MTVAIVSCDYTFSLSVDQSYEDTEEQFYAEPFQWLAARYHGNQEGKPLPTHLVMFDVLVPVIQEFLSENLYSEVSVAVSITCQVT